MTLISPLAPKTYPTLAPLKGTRFLTAQTGIRYKNRPDLLLIELAAGTTVAGGFTLTRTAAAPVEWCKSALKSSDYARALVVNAGNANAFTGTAGTASVQHIVQTVTKLLNCDKKEVFVASTGVIGQPLQDHIIVDALSAIHHSTREATFEEAAQAISTTDTFFKISTRTAVIGDAVVTISGIAKGSGMIAPNMATMLAFIFTDALIPAAALQALFNKALDCSFNAITVDGDTSTNDTVLLFATGQVEHPRVVSHRVSLIDDFCVKLEEVCTELAQLVVRDGEGASKFIAITVKGAASDMSARRIALSIGNSPLVKTAIAGEDANWGRIVMAIGKAGEKISRDDISIQIGDVLVAEAGAVHPDYREEQIVDYMKGKVIEIKADVGVGNGSSTIWTCDLTHGYIDINADYRS